MTKLILRCISLLSAVLLLSACVSLTAGAQAIDKESAFVADEQILITDKLCEEGAELVKTGDSAVYHSGLFSYIITGNVATIVKCDPAVSGEITFPKTIDGYAVDTVVGHGVFENCSELESIIFVNGVYGGCISIYHDSFTGCTGLRNVTFYCPVKLYTNAFSGCSALESLTIGSKGCIDGVYKTDYSKITDCPSLHKIIYTGTLEEWCALPFENKVNNPLYAAHHLYINHQPVVDLVVPDTLTSINANAFCECTGLESVTFGKNIVSIQNQVFTGCTGLQKVNYTGTLKDWCNINFSGLESNPLYYAHELYLDDQRVTSPVIPDDVTRIKNYSFVGWYGLENITLGKGVSKIGYSAFYDCTGLRYVNYTGSIGDWCRITFNSNPLNYAHKLYLDGQYVSDLMIPDTVSAINDYAFRECDIESLTISNNVTKIGSYAFFGCTDLNEVVIAASVKSIGNMALGYYDNNSYQKITNFTIYGYKRTEAERYARNNQFRFVPLNGTNTILGDVDGDEDLTITDGTCILRKLSRIELPFTFINQIADIDQSNVVSVVDATILQKHLAALNTDTQIGKLLDE